MDQNITWIRSDPGKGLSCDFLRSFPSGETIFHAGEQEMELPLPHQDHICGIVKILGFK